MLPPPGSGWRPQAPAAPSAPLPPVGSLAQPPPPLAQPLGAAAPRPPQPLGYAGQAPPQPPGAGTMPAVGAPLAPSQSSVARRDDNVLGNILGGSSATAPAAPPMAPLAPSAPPGPPAPPAPLPTGPLAPSAAAPFPLPGTAPGAGLGQPLRPKPPPIDTSLSTPRLPDGSTTAQRDSAVLAGILQQPGAPAPPQQPPGFSQQLAPSLAQGGLQQPQRRDDAVLGSFMQQQQQQPASQPPPVGQPQVGGQAGAFGAAPAAPPPRRDDAVLAGYLGAAPAAPQPRHDDAVLAGVLGGQLGGVGIASSAPQPRRDDAVLAGVLSGQQGVALNKPIIHQDQQSRDDTALEQLLGLGSPHQPAQPQGIGISSTVHQAYQPQAEPVAFPRRVDFKTTSDDGAMASIINRPPGLLASAMPYTALADDISRKHPATPGSLRQRQGGASLTASVKRLNMQPRGRVAVPKPGAPRRTRVPPGPRQGHQRDILEERAKANLEEENLDLRKHQNEMKKQLQQLEIKLRRAKSSGREGGDAKQAWSDVEKLQHALTSAGEKKVLRQGSTSMNRGSRTPTTPGGPRGQRQGSQRRIGSGAAVGRLRGRMTNLPWGQAMGIAPAPSATGPTPAEAASGAIALGPGETSGVLQADGRRSRSRSASPSPVPSYRDGSYGAGTTPPWQKPSATDPAGVSPYPQSPSARSASPVPGAARARSRSGSPLPGESARPFSPTPSLGPLMPANVPPLGAKEPWSPRKPFGADLGPLGVSLADDALGMRLRDEAEELRLQKRNLSEKLDELLVGRISDEHEKHRFKEKARLKEQMIKNLEKALERERQKSKDYQASLQNATRALQTDVAVARNDLHHSRALIGVAHEIGPLKEKLKDLQDKNALLTKEIRDLTVGAFCATTGNRMVTQQKLDELTKQIEKKDQDCAQMVTDQQAVDTQRTQAAQESAQFEQQCRTLMEENERLTIRMEEKAEGVRRAQEQLNGIMDNLDPEDKKVLMFSLQFLREREAAKSNQQLLDAVVQGASRPTISSVSPVLAGQGDLSVEETTHLVDSLRAEKDDLAQEIRAIQDISIRERGIIKDLRTMHRIDMDELALQIQVTMEDTERCRKLASEREKRIEELQKEVVRRKRLAGAQTIQPKGADELAKDVVSEAGFSGLTELEGINNALDIYLTAGRLEERALLEMPRPASGEEVPLETALVTMVLVEFMHFDVGCSEEAASLRPRYDSLISFGPFEVNDAVIEHYARGVVSFELQAFAVGATSAYTLGRASLPLAVMLDCTPQDPNPVVTGTLSFAAETDVRLQIATIQYKARWRKTALEALALYTARCGSPAAIKAATADGGGGVRAAAGLMDAVRSLIVQIVSVEGLQSYRTGVPPEALRPYVSFQVPGHKQHSTDTMTGPSCRFEDTSTTVVRVDSEFCRWADKAPAEGGGLHLAVFDSAAPALPGSAAGLPTAPGQSVASATEEQLGVLGEVWVPLGDLLKSAFAGVQGTFPLRRGTGKDAQPAGIITVNIRWKDDASAVLAAPGVGAPDVAHHRASGVLSEEQYQIMWQRVIRRLHVLKMTAMDWFYKHDADQDGFWTKQEARNALCQMPIGISPLEIDYIFDRMDVRRRGLVAPTDLGSALAEGGKAAPLELWARDCYRRISEALLRQGQTPEQAFCAVAQGWQAQKRDFFALLTSLDLGMKPDQLEWLWKLSDATSAGILDFREFAARLREAAGTGSTAFTLPRGAQEALQAPASLAMKDGAGAPQGPMSETGFELCLFRILRSCFELGWRTIDKIMQELGAREDGVISRANLVTFCLRARARLSDWEVEQITAKLDAEGRGAVDPRALRTVLLRCDISDSQCQVAARRAMGCIGRIRQGLLKRKPPGAAAANPGLESLGGKWRALLEELATQKVPLVATRQDFVSAVVQVGIDDGQWQLEELWAFVDKMRDGSLDIDAFVVQMAATPLPGEVSVDAMSDEHFAILMGRLKKALDRLNLGTVEKAFAQFRTGSDGCISPMELETALAQVVDNLAPHERKLLVGRIDSNKDGRISFVELEAALSRASVSAISHWAEDVCQRILGSLRREGKTLDTLFDALAKDSPYVIWPSFEALFAQLEPSLSLRQLQHLWQAFDKNGDGGVSREEFKRAFVAVQEESAAPQEAAVAASSHTDVLLSRIYRVLGVGPLSVRTALAVYDTMADGSLDWNQWRHAVLSLRLPLSEPEAAAVHSALARNNASGRMLLSVFEAEVARMATQTLPEERWARSFISSCAQRALESGAPTLEQVLAAGNQEAVEEAVMLSALNRNITVSEEQWVRLRPLLERRPEDGYVLWAHFLRWASVPLPAAGVAPASAMEADVCARISRSLRDQGKSADELFVAVAKGGVMDWPAFVTLFASLEPSLTVQQLQHLWQSFDKNGDGGVTREEFRRGLVSQVEAPVAAPAVPPTPSHSSVCSRIRTALQRQGQTPEMLFNAIAKGNAIISWQDFITFLTQLEPTLTVVQLERLWKSFDKDGSGGVSCEEFQRGIALDIVEQPDFGTAVASTVPAAPEATGSIRDVCSRVLDALRRNGQSVDDLFVALSKGAGIVRFDDFVNFFASLEPGLTRAQLDSLWRSFDKDGDCTVSREEFVNGLVLPPEPPAAAGSVRDVCSRVLEALQRNGQSVDDLFVALSKGAGVVRFDDFANFFASLEPGLTRPQLESLWRSFDKNGDSAVSREEFVQGLVLPPVVEQPTAAPPAAVASKGVPPTASANDVCSRVLAAMTRQGKTVDELFRHLAKDGILYFADFHNFFRQIEPSLSEQQLDCLWRSFDANADRAVSLAEFQRGLQVAHPEVGSGALASSGESVVSRIDAALKRSGQTVDQLFDKLAKGGFVVWEDFATLFSNLEPSLTAAQLLELWKGFDNNLDGGVSREEFRRGLAISQQAAAPSASPKMPASVPTSVNTELVRKVLEAIIAVAAYKGGNVQSQLQTFDTQGTGRLNRQAFAQAMLSYSPGLSEEVLGSLWEHLGGPTADAVGIPVVDLAARLSPQAAQGTPEHSPSASGDMLWSALRRVRSTLHARSWRPQSAFDKLTPAGMSRLPRDALGKGLTAIGCPLLEPELAALFSAMSPTPEDVKDGVKEQDFVTVFAIMGTGFDEYAKDLFSRVGTALSSRFGSLVSAFEKALDVTGQGSIGKSIFKDALVRYGDMNLVEAQVDRCWQLATAAGGGRTTLDFPTLQKVLSQADTGPPQATSEFMLTLEEACSHFDQLGRTANLRKALTKSGPEGRVRLDLLSSVLHGVAPELSDAEVEQICRLAPRSGGPLSHDDSYDYTELLARFESGRNDWHPIGSANDRKLSADICRYISQQVVAAGFKSFADFVSYAHRPQAVGTSLPPPMMLGHLQRWLPPPISKENKELTEFSLMRLGTILPNGGMDLAEFYARFEQLAKGGPLSAYADTGAGVGLIADTSSTEHGTSTATQTRSSSQGIACPVDIRVVSAQKQAEIAARLGSEYPTGEIVWDKLHRILEESKVHVSYRNIRRLKEWLAPLPHDLCKWPHLFAFTVGVDQISIAADKFTRHAYSFLQLEVSFCGESVKFPVFGWKFSLMQCVQGPKKMSRTFHHEARFNIDGPNRISREDLAAALQPQPPSSHRIRITLYGLDSEEAGSSAYPLGTTELCLRGDVPSRDLHQGSTGSERMIDWELSIQSRDKPRLHATLSLRTRNAGRLRLLFGV